MERHMHGWGALAILGLTVGIVAWGTDPSDPGWGASDEVGHPADRASGDPRDPPTQGAPGPAHVAREVERIAGIKLPRIFGPPEVADDFAFSRMIVSNEIHNGEPVVHVMTNDDVWVAGTAFPNDVPMVSHLWRKQAGGFVEQPQPTNGPGDATIFQGTDGRLYWAALRAAGQPNYELHLSSAQAAGIWETEMFSGYDRPWFASRLGATFAVADNTQADRLDLFVADGQGGWADPVGVPNTSGTSPGYPSALSDGRLVVPLNAGQTRKLAVSNADVSQWTVHDIPGPAEGTGILWSSVDSADHVYVAWDNRDVVKYVSWSSVGFLGPFTVSDGIAVGKETWSVAIDAGAEGRLNLGWYERLDGGPVWSFLLRQVHGAHLDPPDLGLPVVAVEAHAADALNEARRLFLDFATIDHLADGSAVLAFNCHLRSDPLRSHPYCPREAASFVAFAVQTAGPRI